MSFIDPETPDERGWREARERSWSFVALLAVVVAVVLVLGATWSWPGALRVAAAAGLIVLAAFAARKVWNNATP